MTSQENYKRGLKENLQGFEGMAHRNSLAKKLFVSSDMKHHWFNREVSQKQKEF